MHIIDMRHDIKVGKAISYLVDKEANIMMIQNLTS